MEPIKKGAEGSFTSALASSLADLLAEAFPDRPMNFFVGFYDKRAEEEGIGEVGIGYFVTNTKHKQVAKLLRGLAEKMETEEAERN